MNLLQLLAITIYLEAGNQPYEGKVAVAQVIMERVSDGRWPDTIRTVIMKPKHFSCWNGRSPNDVSFVFNKAGRECLKIAEDCLDGKILGEGYNHYCRYDCNPSWLEGVDRKRFGKRIGDHEFFKL